MMMVMMFYIFLVLPEAPTSMNGMTAAYLGSDLIPLIPSVIIILTYCYIPPVVDKKKSSCPCL